MPVEINETISLQLKQLAHKYPKVRDKVLTDAGTKIAVELEKLAPHSKIDRKYHTDENVTVSKVNKEGELFVGWNKQSKIASRVHFVEFGTIKQRPTNFIGKTVESMKDDINRYIAKELKKGLGLK